MPPYAQIVLTHGALLPSGTRAKVNNFAAAMDDRLEAIYNRGITAHALGTALIPDVGAYITRLSLEPMTETEFTKFFRAYVPSDQTIARYRGIIVLIFGKIRALALAHGLVVPG